MVQLDKSLLVRFLKALTKLDSIGNNNITMSWTHICACTCNVIPDIEFFDISAARASMSTEYKVPYSQHVFSAGYAIDGNETNNPDQCFCCAGASESPSKWYLDLRKQYFAAGLIFIGRDDSK